MNEVKGEVRSGCPLGIGPSGKARRVLLLGKEEVEDPAGEDGDMTA